MPVLAKIREIDCIGCTKCIQACPVDVIVGASQQMHTVLVDECIGCKLCVAPCPVDCIDLITVEKLTFDPHKSKYRHQARKKRLELQKDAEKEPLQEKNKDEKLAYIQAALQRMKHKRHDSEKD